MIVLLFIFIASIMFGPPILFTYLGNHQKRLKKKEKAKVLYIIAVVYLIIGLGICGTILKTL